MAGEIEIKTPQDYNSSFTPEILKKREAVMSDNMSSKIISMHYTKSQGVAKSPFRSMYTIIWIDAMHYKVKDGGRIESRTVYNVLAVNSESRKGLIGMFKYLGVLNISGK